MNLLQDQDRLAFYRQLAKDPGDRNLRLVFADWFDDRGEAETAAYYRRPETVFGAYVDDTPIVALQRGLSGQRVVCRVLIEGWVEFPDGNVPFVHMDEESYTHTNGKRGAPQRSQYCWSADEDHPDGDPSTYWWTEGNFSCDCNRDEFLHPELFHRFEAVYGSNENDVGNVDDLKTDRRWCSEHIRLRCVLPLELHPDGSKLPPLYLEEV